MRYDVMSTGVCLAVEVDVLKVDIHIYSITTHAHASNCQDKIYSL